MYRQTLFSIRSRASKIAGYSTWQYEKFITKATPQFIVTPENGFLPRNDPLDVLPLRFHKFEKILQDMPLEVNGKKGLLAKGDFGNTIRNKLPLYNVDDITDSALLMALFRDYTFAASSYLLEPCDLEYKKTGNFGLGRDHLPASIAIPLTKISQKIKAKPFMEYAQSYALYNYKRIDKYSPPTYENLKLIRQFSGLPSESGFILVHVDMVSMSNKLVQNVITALDSAAKNDRKQFDSAMSNLVTILQKVNMSMEKMWKRSNPADYMKFRTFILGTKNQETIFPNGVKYEGCFHDKPQFFRGESGANDSIVPTIDNLLQIFGKMPKNEMTDILKDFRTYRPQEHSCWLQWVEKSAIELNIEKYSEGSCISLANYIMLLNEIRDFRSRHWNFAKEYIIKRTMYPKATGGSPMSSWLPNQLAVILQTMINKCTLYKSKCTENVIPDEFVISINSQLKSLNEDTKRLSGMYGAYAKKYKTSLN